MYIHCWVTFKLCVLATDHDQRKMKLTYTSLSRCFTHVVKRNDKIFRRFFGVFPSRNSATKEQIQRTRKHTK